jgi:hypothetical protein
MTRRLADKMFASSDANRDDVGVNELHNCFAANEVQVCVVQHLDCAPSETGMVLSSAGTIRWVS